MTQRRDFLKQAGLLAAAAYAQPLNLLAAPAPTKVGIQLYSLRDYIGQDAKSVLAKVAKAGYQEVETFGYSAANGYWGMKPAEFKSVLAANGLSTPSGHYGLDSFFRDGSETDLNNIIAAARGCGQSYLVVPSLDSKMLQSAADFKTIASRLNQAGKRCQAAGLQLGYHNHNFEFKPVDGTMLYDVMLRETDPKLVVFEMDLYWVVRAGQDPAKLIQAHPGRFPLWHVKDMDKAKPELNTEVGSGSIDFRKLAALGGTAGLKHLFMEQENFGMDAYQSIAQSAAYMKANVLPLLKKG